MLQYLPDGNEVETVGTRRSGRRRKQGLRDQFGQRDQVDLVAATELGVPVFNSPFQNTRSVAELVVCWLIMLARRMYPVVSEMHKGNWQKTAKGCFEVYVT